MSSQRAGLDDEGAGISRETAVDRVHNDWTLPANAEQVEGG